MKTFTLRLDTKTYEKLLKLAEKENRSLNSQIKQLIQNSKGGN